MAEHRPAEGRLVGLVEAGADEQAVLAQLVGQVGEAARARPVEVPHGRELLTSGDDLVRAHRLEGVADRLEPRRPRYHVLGRSR
jgi:hypothetical protein